MLKPDIIEKLKETYSINGALSFVDTHIPGIRLFYIEKSIELNPILYGSGLAILCQGEKRGVVGTRQFHYNRDQFLIVSVSTPLTCRTVATKEEPAFGFFIESEISLLQEVSKNMDFHSCSLTSQLSGVEPAEVTPQIKSVIDRLAEVLLNPTECNVLGEGMKKELLFRALQSDHGHSLFSLTQDHSPQFRIYRVIEFIKQHMHLQVTIEQLAELANMSATSFHRHFKQITGEAPMQYVKKIKLSKARALIVHKGVSVSTAALEVGYNNASQFTREFKRHYNVTPTDAKDSGYSAIDIGQP